MNFLLRYTMVEGCLRFEIFNVRSCPSRVIGKMMTNIIRSTRSMIDLVDQIMLVIITMTPYDTYECMRLKIK